MARTKKIDTIINGNIPLPAELQPVQKDIRITGAKIKDSVCTYDYRYLTGLEKGIPQTAKKGTIDYIIKKDLKDAFAKFHVHMAILIDMYKHVGIEVTDCNTLHGHELTELFYCDEFEIMGEEDVESVRLFGTKYCHAGSVPIETARVALDSLSSYKWYNELKAAVDTARLEVELYKHGKYTIPEDQVDDEEEEEKKGKKKQTKFKFEKPVGEDTPSEEGITDAEFEEDSFEDVFGEAKL